MGWRFGLAPATLEELGPAYMLLINLSVVDWVSLSEEDKDLNTQMRLDWLASYSKASKIYKSTKGSRTPALVPEAS